MLSKDTCKVVGIALGQELEITIGPDPNPGHAALPDELAAALAAWPEAEVAFNQHSGAHRRDMARLVDEAKQSETRIRRALTLTEHLIRGLHPFRGS